MIPESEIIFKVSGSALSFLYYECDKSRMDQVGFLIGEKHSFVKKTISDAQMNGEKNETIINIVAVLPIGSPFLFCNNAGRIDKDKLKVLLGSVEKDICGWYIFRRNSGLNPLLRNTILHRELLDSLPHVMAESFVLCCIGSDTSQLRSTHRFRHVFLLHKNRNFEPISVPVINLGQPEDVGYRAVAVTSSSNTSFNDIASFIRLDSNLGGLAALKALQKPLQERIMEIAAEVQQFDRKTQQLVNEIQKLKYNDLMKKCQTQNIAGKKNQDEDGTGDHENSKCGEKHSEEEGRVEGEVKKLDGEEGSQDGDSSEEVVFCSQEIEKPKVGMQKKEFSPVTRLSHNSDKIIIDESNSPPSNSQNSPLSQEY